MSLEVFPDMYPVTIAGVAQQTPAWTLLNPQDLLNPPEPRGSNLLIPLKHGRRGVPHFDEEQAVDLRYIFDGNHDAAGDVWAEGPLHGLALNKRFFTGAVYRATQDDEGAVQCVVTDGDGTDYSGPIQVGAPRFSEGLYDCTAVMTVVILRELVEGGS